MHMIPLNNTRVALKIFLEQIEKAAKENKSIIILGDANLDSEPWDKSEFIHRSLAEELKLALTGLIMSNLGKTYLADRLNEEGETI